MVILGVDPGIASVGYGVVSYEKNRFTALEYDTFRTPAGQQLSERLLQIFNFFEQLLSLIHILDYEAIERALKDHPAMVYLQRSRGYAVRPSIFVEEIARCV